MAGKGPTRKATKNGADGAEQAEGRFSAEELAAMKERALELKQEARRAKRGAKDDGEKELLAKVAEMEARDRALAEKVHGVVTAHAPGLTPRTWYGMPAYAKDGKVLLFFQASAKFKVRYSTLGFNDGAALDEGSMWPVAYALREWTPAVEERVVALVTRAAG